MKYKVLPRRVTLLVYADDDPINYTASCQVNINGNRGTIDTLMGGDFYKLLVEQGFDVFKDMGLVEVSAMVSTSHIRLLKRYLKEKIIITEEGGIFMEGIPRDFVWVRITEK